MATKVSSSKLTEDTNNSADCGEEGVGITAELHNGEEVGTPNDSKGDPKTKKEENENPKKAVRMGTGDSYRESSSEGSDLSWHLYLSGSDNEVEASERIGDKSEKLPGDNNPLLDTDADDSVDFLGFEMGTASSEDLTKLIGHVESALECAKRDLYGASTSHDFEDLEAGFGDDDTEMKLASYRIGTSSEIFIDYDAMDADDCETIKYSLKLISNADVPRTREERMQEDISSSDSADGVGNVGKIDRGNRRSKNLMKMKQENKFFSGDGAGSETRKKRKKFKEDEVQAGDVFSLQDTNLQVDLSIEVSGTASEAVSSEVTSSAASNPSVCSRSSLKICGSGGRYSRGDSPPLSSSGGQGKKDLSNPAYLKPFEYGWKRELVYRNTSESKFKKKADVYYYTPSGKKARSRPELQECLMDSEDLTIENFTFFKEALGIDDPSKERIRDAKRILTKDPSATSTKKTTKMKPVSEKSSSLPEALNSSTQSESPKSSHQGRTAPSKNFPKIKRLPLSKLCSNGQKKNDSSENGKMEICNPCGNQMIAHF